LNDELKQMKARLHAGKSMTSLRYANPWLAQVIAQLHDGQHVVPRTRQQV
jgi:hypothetical protein